MIAARKPLGRRWRLPLLALGFCLGATAPHTLTLLGLAVALAAPAAARVRRAWGAIAALAGLGCLLGGMRAAEPWRPPAPSVAEAPFRYRGVVEDRWTASDPAALPAAELLLRLEGAPPASGLWTGARLRIVVWQDPPAVQIGDEIELAARARSPRGLCNGGRDPFGAAARRDGIHAEAAVKDGRVLWQSRRERARGVAALGRIWRARIREAIEQASPGVEGAVVRALVLGDRRGLDPDLRRAFARTGTAHVLAVSGLHVAMVASAALLLSRAAAMRIPLLAARASAARLGALAAMPAVAGYAWLTEPAAPIVRAAIMAELLLAAAVLCRRLHFPTSLALAAIGVALWQPDAPWDLSAQLSFVTLLWMWAGSRSIPGGAPGPARGPSRGIRARAVHALYTALLATVFATLGAAPLLARHFGEVSLIGLLANPIVVPVMGWGALGLGLVGAAAVAVAPGAAPLCFAASGACVRLAVEIVRELADWPAAVLPVAWRPALVVWTAGIAAAWPAASTRSRIRRGLVAALLTGVALWADVSSRPPLRLRFLDVGQGDAALLELGRAGPRLLVDGGGFASGREPGRSVLLPALRRSEVGRLDAAVVSHPQWDHFGGFETVLREVETGAVWWSGHPVSTPPWRRFRRLARELGIPLRPVAAAERPALPGAAPEHGRIEVLHPGRDFETASANDASLVLAVRFGAFRALLTGDVEARGEAALVASGADLGATVLKVPHHGSRTSSSTPLVAAVRPVLAIASLGRGNPFRLPAAEVVERYRGHGARWESTDRSGELVVRSDGQLSRLERCRGSGPESRRW